MISFADADLERIIAVPSGEGKAALFFLVPYAPFKEFPGGKLSVDAYYLASNAAYRRAKELAEELRGRGIPAEANPKLDYKRLLAGTGEFVIGKNTLLYFGDLGSRFAVGCVEAEMDLPPASEFAARNCGGCGACASACPTGAISEGEFAPERCIRSLMDRTENDVETVKKFGNRLFGCDICQRVCPLNRGETVDPPPGLLEFLDVENVILCAEKGRKALSPLAELIGENYVRPKRILRAALWAKSNMDPNKN